MKINLEPSIASVPQLSRIETAKALQISRHPLAALEATGLLADLAADRVAALARRPWASSDSPLVVVRAGRPAMDADGKRDIGYSTRYSDAQVLEASRQWWVSNPTEVLAAAHILVVVSTWAVAFLAVRGVADRVTMHTQSGQAVVRISYDADLTARVDNLVEGGVRQIGPTPKAIAPLLRVLGNRVPSPPGAPLIIGRPSSADDAPSDRGDVGPKSF